MAVAGADDDDVREQDFSDAVGLVVAKHGEPGHRCDHDAYPRSGDPTYKGPHVTKVIRACATDDEWRAACACQFLSDILPTRNAALVKGWLHRRRVTRSPRGQ